MAGQSANQQSPIVYLVSPRRGGPYKQLQLIAFSLRQLGYKAYHCSSLIDWVKLHFNRRHWVISVIPFFFMLNKERLILNIRGNYRHEKRLTNPLSLLYGYNLKFANQVVVPSQYLQRELELPQAKIIPNCTAIKYQARVKKNRDYPVRLVTITNFDFRPKAQGVCSLINIVNQLETRPVEFHVYGSGKWLEYTQNQHETHNYKKFPVYFHGSFKSAEDILPDKDVFLYWSEFDNMPNVLLEAAACGLPVIANRFAAYEEILGKNGLLANNEQEFSIYLHRLIENRQERDVITREQLDHIQQFYVNNIIKKWLQVIQK